MRYNGLEDDGFPELTMAWNIRSIPEDREALLRLHGHGVFSTEQEELDARREFMLDRGYSHCGIAACNCNSWHTTDRHVEAALHRKIQTLEDVIKELNAK